MATNPESSAVLSPLVRALVAHGLVSEAAVRPLAEEAARFREPLIFFLVEKGAVGAGALMEYLGERYGMPMVELDAVEPDEGALKLLDRKLMERYRVMPLSRRGSHLYVAVADPTDFKAFDDIKFNTGLQVTPVLAEADKLRRTLGKVTGSMQGKMADLFAKGGGPLAVVDEEDEEFDLNKADATEDAPVVRFAQQLLLDAIQRGASDIHIEPYEKDVRIRYRIDGLLHDVLHPPMQLKEGVTSRLKILCRLDISERRLPQDGRLRVRVARNRVIDFRVSFLPTYHGETIVLRLLDPASAKVGIEQLGYLPEQRTAFEWAIKRPYGMILVTGPTGSGKTTTLYTALNILNTGDVNISTAEDPVELTVYGINQVNVNEKIGLDFATVLRSFLRQDPDVIMVGEVRDLETAETAIKAAQTGHLVLATLHTNDAPQTLTRLQNMGIPAYNVASSVILVMAQRLARRLCEHCRKPEAIPEKALIDAGFKPDDLRGWRPQGPKGCERCNNTGYKGRIGLYQVMPVSDAMREIILRGGTAMELARQAEEEGVLSMRQSGLRRVMDGTTSLEEVLRVTN